VAYEKKKKKVLSNLVSLFLLKSIAHQYVLRIAAEK